MTHPNSPTSPKTPASSKAGDPVSSSVQGSPEKVAEIVAGLTEAQKRCILYGWPDSRRGFWPVRNALSAKGLLPLSSPLTCAVRAALTQSPDAAAAVAAEKSQ